MTDYEALMAAVLAQPGDDTCRLVLADCLEENGDNVRAEFIRTQVMLASGSYWDALTKQYVNNPNVLSRQEWYDLQVRERELLKLDCVAEWWGCGDMASEIHWSRGFVFMVNVDWKSWVVNHKRLRAAHPITTVMFLQTSHPDTGFTWHDPFPRTHRYTAFIDGCNRVGSGTTVSEAFLAACGQAWQGIKFLLTSRRDQDADIRRLLQTLRGG